MGFFSTPSFISDIDPTKPGNRPSLSDVLLPGVSNLPWIDDKVDQAGRYIDPTTSNGLLTLGTWQTGLPLLTEALGGKSVGDAVDDVGGAIRAASGNGEQTITNVPWEQQQPYLLDLFSRANGLYNDAGTLNPAFSDQTSTALNAMYDRGSKGSAAEGAAERNLLSMLSQGFNDPALSGLNSLEDASLRSLNNTDTRAYRVRDRVGQAPGSSEVQSMMQYTKPAFNDLYGTAANISARADLNPALSAAGSVANETINPAVQALQNELAGQGLDDAQTRNMLLQTAQGGFLNSNPHLDATFSRASDAITRELTNKAVPSVNAAFSSAGRTGSNAHMDAFRDEIGNTSGALTDLAAQIYGNNYNTERSFQEAAKRDLGNINSAGADRRLSAIGALGSNYLGGQETRLSGASVYGDLFNRGSDLKLNALNAQNSILNDNVGTQFTGAGILNDQYNADTGTLFNSNAVQDAAAQQNFQNLTGLNARRSDIFNTETGNRFNAINTVPSLSDMNYRNIGAALGAGQTIDNFNTAKAREPYDRLGLFQGSVTGNYGGTQTSSGGGGNPIFGAIGNGIMAGVMSGNPWAGLAAGGASLLNGG